MPLPPVEVRRKLDEIHQWLGASAEAARELDSREKAAAEATNEKELSKSDSEGAPAADEFHIEVHDATKLAEASRPPAPSAAETSSGDGWVVPLLFGIAVGAGCLLLYRRRLAHVRR